MESIKAGNKERAVQWQWQDYMGREKAVTFNSL